VPDVGVAVRGIDDAGVVAVDVIAEPDMLRDEIGSGVSTDGVGAGLGGGRGGDGEGVSCTGGGSISETGISETSPALPSSKGDSVDGGDGGSIIMLFRRGEPARNGEALRTGVEERIALVDAEDV
jgi:hypothetical protein